jgi:hypothetical protein
MARTQESGVCYSSREMVRRDAAGSLSVSLSSILSMLPEVGDRGLKTGSSDSFTQRRPPQ